MRAYLPVLTLIWTVLLTAWQTYYVSTLIATGNVCGCAILVPRYISLFFDVGVAAGIALLEIVSAHAMQASSRNALSAGA